MPGKDRTSYEALKQAYNQATKITQRRLLSYAAFKMSTAEWSHFIAYAPLREVPPGTLDMMADPEADADNEAVLKLLECLKFMRERAEPWGGPPGYTRANAAGGVYACFAEPDNTDNYLTAVYLENEGGDDEVVMIVTPDLEGVLECTRGSWEASLLEAAR